MKLGDYIRKNRKEKGLSAKELSQISSVSEGHILYIEREKRRPTFQVISKLIKALNLRWNDFLRETGYIGTRLDLIDVCQTRRIPIVSLVNAGKFEKRTMKNNCRDSECIKIDREEPNIFAVKVTCDSMIPVFIEGDILIIDPDKTAKHDNFVLAGNGKKEVTLKQLKIYGQEIVLHPLNPKYSDIVINEDEYHIIGVVVERKTQYN